MLPYGQRTLNEVGRLLLSKFSLVHGSHALPLGEQARFNRFALDSDAQSVLDVILLVDYVRNDQNRSDWERANDAVVGFPTAFNYTTRK